MRFESPWLLLLLLLTPLFFRRKKQPSNALLFSSPLSLAKLKPERLRHFAILQLIHIASYVMLVLAVARPQYGTEFTETEASGRDIIIALDTSGSMQALDFFLDGDRVNRLVALQQVVKQFIAQRKGDRIGLVVFGDKSFTQCPLTLDSRILTQFVDALEIGMSGKGTAVGDGIAVALKQIRQIESDSKVVILVTDGKSNSGISPREAAKIAQKLGVKIHTIGIGGEGYAPFPTETIFGHTMLVDRKLEFDEQTLKDIAQITGGQYFYAKDTERLQQVYAEIDRLEERKEIIHEYVEYQERFFPFLLIGFILFLTYETLRSTVLLRIP